MACSSMRLGFAVERSIFNSASSGIQISAQIKKENLRLTIARSESIALKTLKGKMTSQLIYVEHLNGIGTTQKNIQNVNVIKV